MKPVDDWHNWWRWHSTYIYGVLVAFPIAWDASPQLQAALPPHVVSIAAPVVAVIGFGCRLHKQVGLHVTRSRPHVPPPTSGDDDA